MDLKNTTIKYSVGVLAVFYLVGIVGFILPATHQLFIRLIPLALLLSLGFLIWFHRPKFTIKVLLIFGIIFLVSFFAEVVGVKTGFIFGSYRYHGGLGIKILDTPLMIGMNWLMLVYCSKIITEKLFTDSTTSLFFAPILMVLYDLVMEQAAPVLGMWSWNGGKIPVQNFVAWYLLAFLFHLLLQKTKTVFSNKMAGPVFVIQFLFFVVLVLNFLTSST